MSLDEFLFRMKARFSGLIHSEQSLVRVSSRFGALAIFAAVITTLAPTLADELASSPEILEAPIVAAGDSTTAQTFDLGPKVETPTVPSQVSGVLVTYPSVEVVELSALVEPSDSETAVIVELPPAPLEIQPRYTLQMPGSVKVDPRATSYLMPRIYASTGDDSQITLACISGSGGLAFHARDDSSAEDFEAGSTLISGNRSEFLMISTNTPRLINIINSNMGLPDKTGLRTYSNSGLFIANKSLFIQFVAVTRPVVDPAFCSAAKSTASTLLRPLSLQQSTVKGSGKLK